MDVTEEGGTGDEERDGEAEEERDGDGEDDNDDTDDEEDFGTYEYDMICSLFSLIVSFFLSRCCSCSCSCRLFVFD